MPPRLTLVVHALFSRNAEMPKLPDKLPAARAQQTILVNRDDARSDSTIQNHANAIQTFNPSRAN